MTRTAPTLAVLAALGVFATVACQAPAPPAAPAPPDHASTYGPTFDRYIAVLNTQDYSKLDGLFAPNFRRIAPDQNTNGPEEMETFIRRIHAAYPYFKIAKGESLYEDGLSFNQWTVTGTGTAKDGTRKAIEVTGVTILRYANGRITEERVYYDTVELTNQLSGDMPHAK